jgi:tRNA(Ile)-lysidine synthase
LNINAKIYSAIEKFEMFQGTNKILVGISGGADSVCLLHFLSTCAKTHNMQVFAVHVNHCIRENEADRDENFVRDFCSKIGVPFYLEKASIPRISSETKTGTEECGRNVRYQIFNNIAEKLGAKIATAHTLSDSIETVFLNIIRGCSINGICGIPATRGRIIRPLIHISRGEVESYCKEHNLKYVFDSSNNCKDYNRNKIRLEAVPVLKRINPSFEKCFKRFLDSVSEDKNYLENVSKIEYEKTIISNEKHKYNIKIIKKAPPPVKNRVIYKILENLSNKKNLECRHVNLISEMISNNKNGCITLRSGIQICIKGNILYKKDPQDKKNIKWKYELKDINFLTPLGITFIIKVVKKEEFNILKAKENKNIVGMLDYDKIPKSSVFRNRREEDVFSPINRGITKLVKNLFNELKILPSDRYKIPMIGVGNQIIWIYGVGESETFKIDENTQNAALILRGENIDDRRY